MVTARRKDITVELLNVLNIEHTALLPWKLFQAWPSN